MQQINCTRRVLSRRMEYISVCLFVIVALAMLDPLYRIVDLQTLTYCFPFCVMIWKGAKLAKEAVWDIDNTKLPSF